MNYNDILKLKNNDVVDNVSGKVVGVYIKDPTPAQKNSGIHVQDVVLQDDNGDKIRARINSAGMHLDAVDARGRTFTFESAPNEKGKLSGLAANVYNGQTTINVYKDAIITGDKAKPATKAHKPAEEVPLFSQPSPQSNTRVDIDDHIAALCGMVKKMDDNLGETGLAETTPEVYSDFLVRLATTVYIQSCKDGLIKKRETFKAPTVLVEGKPVDTRRVSVKQVVDMAFAGELTAEKLKELDGMAQYNWEEVYEEVEDRLIKQGHDEDAIAAAFDDTKAHYIKLTKNFSSPDFIKVVLADVPTFTGAVETAAESLLQPEATRTVNTDDIPF